MAFFHPVLLLWEFLQAHSLPHVQGLGFQHFLLVQMHLQHVERYLLVFDQFLAVKFLFEVLFEQENVRDLVFQLPLNRHDTIRFELHWYDVQVEEL